MYELVRGTPLEKIDFELIKAKSGHNRYKVLCEDIFTFDTETSSTYIVNGKVTTFNYNNPKESQEAEKHSLCYIWQFGINEDTRYIGRELTDFVLLLRKLNKFCPYPKTCYVHNLAFDFCFLQNVLTFESVFARTPRHPMKAHVKEFNLTFKCSYVLMNLGLESWAKALKLPAKKLVGQLDYKTIRTPKTPLTNEELDYCITDLDVMYYGLLKLKKQYGTFYKIPLTHTGKVRLQCQEVMKNERGYCKKVTALMPNSLQEYLEQAHAFVGGTVLCNWLYKNRVIEDIIPYDIASSYPWVLVACKYPMGRFYKAPKGKETQYMHNDKYVYIIRFKAYNVESKYNCHFLSRSKALKLIGSLSDNGRLVSADMCEYILTSVDYELFLKAYEYSHIDIISFKFSIAKYLNDNFRRFVLELYKDKTTLKGVEGQEDLYQNKKESINSLYGDFVTKIFSDSIVYDFGDKENIWKKKPLTEEQFLKDRQKLDKKRYKNYKAFIQGIFVTAWARKRLWDGILYEDMDEHVIYTDTDSLKMFDYKGDFFEMSNKEILRRHEELKIELGVTDEELSPKDIKGISHPIGIWEHEKDVKRFKSLGCKQYICEYEDGSKSLTCAGISKLAVNCFNSVEEFKIDRRLSELELKNCSDSKGHTAEKLTPYYSIDYPNVVYPDGYISRYKCGICLMPTTFNLSITPADLQLLYTEVLQRLNQIYYSKSI